MINMINMKDTKEREAVLQNVAESKDSESFDEKAALIERLKEIEEELYELQQREAERQQEYEARQKDMELKSLESELEAEARALKEEYPGFDPEKELEYPDFVKLVNSGLPMKTAYEALHLEDIRKKSLAEGEKKALSDNKKTTARPDENGVSLKSGGILKSGVHSLSKRERAELAKRAGKGEIIRF